MIPPDNILILKDKLRMTFKVVKLFMVISQHIGQMLQWIQDDVGVI